MAVTEKPTIPDLESEDLRSLLRAASNVCWAVVGERITDKTYDFWESKALETASKIDRILDGESE